MGAAPMVTSGHSIDLPLLPSWQLVRKKTNYVSWYSSKYLDTWINPKPGDQRAYAASSSRVACRLPLHFSPAPLDVGFHRRSWTGPSGHWWCGVGRVPGPCPCVRHKQPDYFRWIVSPTGKKYGWQTLCEEKPRCGVDNQRYF